MSDNQTNNTLWKEIKKLSNGDIKTKIKAVDLVFANYRKFPKSFSLIKELANKTQPNDVRIRVAISIRKAPLKVREHYELINILSQDAREDLSACLKLLSTSSLVNYKLLQNINPSKAINDAIQGQSKLLQNINPSKAINDAIQAQSKLFKDIMRIEMSKFLQSTRWSFLGNDYAKIAKPYVSFLDINKQLTLPFRNQLDKSVGYYSNEELETIKSPPEVPRKTKASEFLGNLQDCKPGRKHWKRYQDVCKEILCYCLVPPLIEPLEQLETRDGTHIRDIIFHIPHELLGFWTFIINKFGLALVIECKNYKDPIKENELRISSKYVGENKLSRLGLIVTRKGLHINGFRAQENIWKDDKKMILCLNDEHVEKMLQLKDEKDEPWKVIDSLIRDFLSSLS